MASSYLEDWLHGLQKFPELLFIVERPYDISIDRLLDTVRLQKFERPFTFECPIELPLVDRIPVERGKLIQIKKMLLMMQQQARNDYKEWLKENHRRDEERAPKKVLLCIKGAVKSQTPNRIPEDFEEFFPKNPKLRTVESICEHNQRKFIIHFMNHMIAVIETKLHNYQNAKKIFFIQRPYLLNPIVDKGKNCSCFSLGLEENMQALCEFYHIGPLMELRFEALVRLAFLSFELDMFEEHYNLVMYLEQTYILWRHREPEVFRESTMPIKLLMLLFRWCSMDGRILNGTDLQLCSRLCDLAHKIERPWVIVVLLNCASSFNNAGNYSVSKHLLLIALCHGMKLCPDMMKLEERKTNKSGLSDSSNIDPALTFPMKEDPSNPARLLYSRLFSCLLEHSTIIFRISCRQLDNKQDVVDAICEKDRTCTIDQLHLHCEHGYLELAKKLDIMDIPSDIITDHETAKKVFVFCIRVMNRLKSIFHPYLQKEMVYNLQSCEAELYHNLSRFEPEAYGKIALIRRQVTILHNLYEKIGSKEFQPLRRRIEYHIGDANLMLSYLWKMDGQSSEDQARNIQQKVVYDHQALLWTSRYLSSYVISPNEDMDRVSNDDVFFVMKAHLNMAKIFTAATHSSRENCFRNMCDAERWLARVVRYVNLNFDQITAVKDVYSETLNMIERQVQAKIHVRTA